MQPGASAVSAATSTQSITRSFSIGAFLVGGRFGGVAPAGCAPRLRRRSLPRVPRCYMYQQRPMKDASAQL
eukprot:scaffold128974_cov57-Phaeocystis_antarctica.AAC.1